MRPYQLEFHLKRKKTYHVLICDSVFEKLVFLYKSIKSQVFSVLTSDIAKIFKLLRKSLTCVASWGNEKNQSVKLLVFNITTQNS